MMGWETYSSLAAEERPLEKCLFDNDLCFSSRLLLVVCYYTTHPEICRFVLLVFWWSIWHFLQVHLPWLFARHCAENSNVGIFITEKQTHLLAHIKDYVMVGSAE